MFPSLRVCRWNAGLHSKTWLLHNPFHRVDVEQDTKKRMVNAWWVITSLKNQIYSLLGWSYSFASFTYYYVENSWSQNSFILQYIIVLCPYNVFFLLNNLTLFSLLSPLFTSTIKYYLQSKPVFENLPLKSTYLKKKWEN